MVDEIPRPTTDDREAWKAYWTAQGMPWRTEPEINEERQQYLVERRNIVPDIEKGIYPFNGVRLDRADIEWLLATHESGGKTGPLYVDEPVFEKREGLDLRGADLRGSNLSSLPLAYMRADSDHPFNLRRLLVLKNHMDDPSTEANSETEAACSTRLEGVNLSETHLEFASLNYTHMEKADLSRAYLQHAKLADAYLQGANLGLAHLEWAILDDANLSDTEATGASFKDARLRRAHLERAQLNHAVLRRAYIYEANLIDAQLQRAQLQKAEMRDAKLEGADLSGAALKKAVLTRTALCRANLNYAHLDEAILDGADLTNADLLGASLAGAILRHAHLAGANLKLCFFDNNTNLEGATFGDEKHRGASFYSIHWGGVNITVVDWSRVKMLGDEYQARNALTKNGETKARAAQLADYVEATRSNRQLATALRDQGMNDEADYFSYRAQLCQRTVLRLQRRWLKCAFSWFLYLMAGYGYRPLRSLVAYLTIIFGFAGLYLLNSHFATPHLRWDEALVLSVSSFHGRGFFSQNITLGDTYARLAAAEAVFGLLIEISFIATFTQRFFAR